MSCTSAGAKAALQRMFLGTLDGAEFGRLRDHAAGCAECRKAYGELTVLEEVLEGRALSADRMALLEEHLLDRWVALPERGFSWQRTLAPIAAAALLVVALAARLPGKEEWHSRGGGGALYGVRAFCIGREGRVSAEARPGQTLPCSAGAAVQLSYTAARSARLSVRVRTSSGQAVALFPASGGAADVQAGVDVLLSYSTPVDASWLRDRAEVTARFTDANGAVLGLSQVSFFSQP